MLRHNLKNGKFNIICSNESCQTRQNDIDKKANDSVKKTKDAKKSKTTSRKSKDTTIAKKTKSE
jgi:DNA topoisomerase-1